MLKHLEPLPISEEMLGAYLEGNLTADEVGYVESCLQADIDMQELVDDVGYTGLDWINENTNDSNLIYSNDVLIDFELPDLVVHLSDDERNDTSESDANDFEITNNDTEDSTLYIDDQEAMFNIADNFEL